MQGFTNTSRARLHVRYFPLLLQEQSWAAAEPQLAPGQGQGQGHELGPGQEHEGSAALPRPAPRGTWGEPWAMG